jgi:hypothetical protein
MNDKSIKIAERLNELSGKDYKESERLIMEHTYLIVNIAKRNGFSLGNYQGLKEQRIDLLKHISRMENDLICENLSDFEFKTKMADMKLLTRMYLYPREYQTGRHSPIASGK